MYSYFDSFLIQEVQKRDSKGGDVKSRRIIHRWLAREREKYRVILRSKNRLRECKEERERQKQIKEERD